MSLCCTSAPYTFSYTVSTNQLSVCGCPTFVGFERGKPLQHCRVSQDAARLRRRVYLIHVDVRAEQRVALRRLLVEVGTAVLLDLVRLPGV